jgi:DNA-directed RNA polymerase II subunit RPB3
MSYQRVTPDSSVQIFVTEKTRSTLEFQLVNVTRHFANSLRRVMISEVPTLAVEIVEISQNTSSLPDEFIAHRIGLVPFYSENEDKFNYTCDCDCDQGCPRCQVIYKLDVTCPSDGPYTVTTKDLIFVSPTLYDTGNTNSDMYKYHEEVRPVSLFTLKDSPVPEPIIIAKLGPGQQLRLIARVQKGVGRVHAKWSPVSISTYHQVAEISFRKALVDDMTEDEKKDIVNSCPEKIFQLGHDGNFVVNKIEDCTFCNQCIRQAEIHNKKDAIIIQSKRGIFIFNIETVGSLSPESVVLKAFAVLLKKLDDFKENVENCPTE